MWIIKFKDTDPDTGEISQEMILAQSDNPFHAEMICHALGVTDEEPNRVYFTTRIKKEDDES